MLVCGTQRSPNNRDLRGLRKLLTSDRLDGWIDRHAIDASRGLGSSQQLCAYFAGVTLRLAIFTPTLRPSKKAHLTRELAESDRAGRCDDSSGPTAGREPPELQQPAIAANQSIRCDSASIAGIISNQSAETRASANQVVVIAGISIGIT